MSRARVMDVNVGTTLLRTVELTAEDDSGYQVSEHLNPREARELAVRLLEAASEAERPPSSWPDDEAQG